MVLVLAQVTGTMLIYSLFMVELFRSDPIESLDEVIYWVNAVSRVLEFVVALCVVAYGTWESLFGEWSWMGASVIIIHSYFNVWLRAQSGWRSFLLRQEAAKKINSLPRATAEQLQLHNDVCSICFQVSATEIRCAESPTIAFSFFKRLPQEPTNRHIQTFLPKAKTVKICCRALLCVGGFLKNKAVFAVFYLSGGVWSCA